MFEGRQEFQFNILEDSAEGIQHISTKSQSKRVRSNAVNFAHHERKQQPNAQEYQLEKRATQQHQANSGWLVAHPPAKKRDSGKGGSGEHKIGYKQTKESGGQFA